MPTARINASREASISPIKDGEIISNGLLPFFLLTPFLNHFFQDVRFVGENPADALPKQASLIHPEHLDPGSVYLRLKDKRRRRLGRGRCGETTADRYDQEKDEAGNTSGGIHARSESGPRDLGKQKLSHINELGSEMVGNAAKSSPDQRKRRPA
mgnify:CR=1 FL=1